MPPAKDYTVKNPFTRTLSNNEMSMSARVYHPATNLMPPTPPLSPTGVAPSFLGNSKSTSSMGYHRQNSQNNGKYS